MKLKRHKFKMTETLAAILFLLPSLAGLSLFFLFPFIDTIKRSFYNAMGNSFMGLQNYISVLKNQSFQLASENTGKFLIISIPLLLVISLILALLMREIQPGGRRLKTLFLLPMAIPVASIVLIWQMLFHENGLVNAVLCMWKSEPINFMGSDAAFWVLVGTYIWKNTGYTMILWLAGLDGISESMYEAAHVDGAGALKCFIHITLPSLVPTSAMVLVISMLNGFKVFREAFLVAGAYPHDSIYMLQHLFNNWFTNMDISRLCSAAVLLCGVLLAIILFIQRWFLAEE